MSAPVSSAPNISQPYVSEPKEQDLTIIDGFKLRTFCPLAEKGLATQVEKISSLFLGNSGMGKTTFFNWIHGCYYVAQRGKLKLVGDKAEIFKTNIGGLSSDTIGFKPYGAWLDSQGLEDNRGDEYELSLSIAFHKLFQSDKIKNIVVTLSAKYFCDKRLKEILPFCNRLSEMIADYEKIKDSIFFVITQLDDAPRHFPTTVKEFIDNRNEIIDSLQGQRKKLTDELKDGISPESVKNALDLFNLMSEKNVFLADLSPGSESLREEFLAKLEANSSPIPKEAFHSKYQGKLKSRLEFIVNEVFKKYFQALEKDLHIKDLLCVLQANIEGKEEDLKKYKGEKIFQEIQQYDPPKEVIKTREQARQVHEKELEKIRLKISTSLSQIVVLAQKITDLMEKPQGSQTKSLKELIDEKEGLEKKNKSLDTVASVVFVHKKHEEKLEGLRKYYGWSTWSYKYDKNWAFESVDLDTPPKHEFRNKVSDPKAAKFSIDYAGWWKQDGKAEVTIKGQSKIRYKEDILSNEVTIKNLKQIIAELMVKPTQHSNEKIEEEKKLADYKAQELVVLNDIQNLVIVENNDFKKLIEDQKKRFEENKDKEIKRLTSKITTFEAALVELKGRKLEISRLGVKADTDLAYLKKFYDEKLIKLLCDTAITTKIKPLFFVKYTNLKQMGEKQDGIPDKFCDGYTGQPVKRVLRHIKCQDGIYDAESITALIKLYISHQKPLICVSCDIPLLEADLIRDEELEKEFFSWSKKKADKIFNPGH